MEDGESSLSKNERGALIAGGAAVLLSFIPGFIRVSFEGKGFDMSTTAWTGSATIGMILLLGAAALIGIEALSHDTLPKIIPWHLIAVIAAVLGTLLLILEAFTAGSSAPGASVGPGWSGWLLFVAAIALSVFAVRSFRDSEEQIDFSA